MTLGRGCATRLQHWISKQLARPLHLLPALQNQVGRVEDGRGVARRFTLNPVIVIVSLFFWDWLWGIPGALLSVPLLAIFKIVCDRIPVLMPLGHMLGASDRRNAVPRPAVA